MKLSKYFYLSLFALSIYSCNSNKTGTEASVKSLIDDLRDAYSSGDQSKWPKPFLDPTVEKDFKDIGHLPKMVFPADNPYSDAKKDLGKILFFDRRLSNSQQQACASCHNPELGWTDNIMHSFGHDRQTGNRNAMSVLNSGYASKLFWDGRAESLEAQALGPIENPVEMNLHLDVAVDRIKSVEGYKALFKAAFGDEEVNKERISKAIATYERTIVSSSTPFDRFIDGDKTALTDQQIQGLHLFRTKARCINCHNGGYFSDNQFRNDGLAYIGNKRFEDLGRYEHTKKPEDLGKFRVPSLREIMRTQPWMHNGSFTPFIDILTFYNSGNGSQALEAKQIVTIDGKQYNVKKDPILQPLNLTREEMEAIEQFMYALSSKPNRVNIPDLPK